MAVGLGFCGVIGRWMMRGVYVGYVCNFVMHVFGVSCSGGQCIINGLKFIPDSHTNALTYGPNCFLDDYILNFY